MRTVHRLIALDGTVFPDKRIQKQWIWLNTKLIKFTGFSNPKIFNHSNCSVIAKWSTLQCHQKFNFENGKEQTVIPEYGLSSCNSQMPEVWNLASQSTRVKFHWRRLAYLFKCCTSLLDNWVGFSNYSKCCSSSFAPSLKQQLSSTPLFAPAKGYYSTVPSTFTVKYTIPLSLTRFFDLYNAMQLWTSVVFNFSWRLEQVLSR